MYNAIEISTQNDTSDMDSTGKHVVDLQSQVGKRLEQAREFLVNRLDAEKIVHLSLQPNYLSYPDEVRDDALSRFLYYKSNEQDIDNDVSTAAFATYLSMHPFLDGETLRRQSYHDSQKWVTVVSDQKLICSSAPGKVLGNTRNSVHHYAGDTLNSMWTPFKCHVNKMLRSGIIEEREESLALEEMLGRFGLSSISQAKELYRGSDGKAFLELLRAHVSPSCLMALDMSDTIGNMVLCAEGCNTTRQSYGRHDTAEYMLAHVWKYFVSGKDVRYLNRLFAGCGSRRYIEYDSIGEVPNEANWCAQRFIAMMERAGCADSWEEYLNAFCFRSFVVEHDAELRPIRMLTGNPIEWDGEKTYKDWDWDDVEDDVKAFSNLTECIIKRNAEIAARIGDEQA